eukprot:SAG31_NODE_2445_length_5681_cov_18.644930_4_plen_72_part_00
MMKRVLAVFCSASSFSYLLIQLYLALLEETPRLETCTNLFISSIRQNVIKATWEIQRYEGEFARKLRKNAF